jgi:DVNP family
MTYLRKIGTRAEVWHGTAKHTSGGLERKDLFQNKHGRIVSKSKHNTAKRERRLVKAGYGTKKGKFGFVKIGSKRGGGNHPAPSAGVAHNSSKVGGRRGRRHSRRIVMGRAGGSRKHRGGNGVNYALSPTEVSGMQGTTASNPSTGVQFAAGMGN